MAAFITETPTQFERDLRSANTEWKRGKDSNIKWSYGATTLHSVWDPRTLDAAEDPSFKPRPLGKPSNMLGSPDKDKGNINKYARTTGRIRDMSSQRVRSKVSAQEEIDDAAHSILDYLPSPRRQSSNPLDNVLYSFDRAESPGRPLTLEVFVKTTGREMEKFVEKEYEVITAMAMRSRAARPAGTCAGAPGPGRRRRTRTWRSTRTDSSWCRRRSGVEARCGETRAGIEGLRASLFSLVSSCPALPVSRHPIPQFLDIFPRRVVIWPRYLFTCISVGASVGRQEF